MLTDMEIADNLQQHFLTAEDDVVERGKVWYLQAHDEAVRLGKQYGISVAQASGIIARLSPGIRWERNVIAAENLLEGESKLDGYRYNAKVARQIAMGQWGDEYVEVLESFGINAPKITNFYANIYDPTDSYPVTLDRWMVRCAYGMTGEVDKVKRNEYSRISNLLRKLAKRHDLLPNQVQAIIWEVIRGK